MGIVSTDEVKRKLAIYSTDYRGGWDALSKSKCLSVSLADVETLLNKLNWISLEDRLPNSGDRVQIKIERDDTWDKSKRHSITTYAVYEDGNTLEDDCSFCGDSDWLRDCGADYNEELEQYYIPEGWYEVLVTLGAEYFNYISDSDKITHWREIID